MVDTAVAEKTSNNVMSWPRCGSNHRDVKIEWKTTIRVFLQGTISDEVEAGAKTVAENGLGQRNREYVCARL